MKKIAIYCVNYHSYDCLNNYLTSIDEASKKAGEHADISVFIADNSIPTEEISYSPNYFHLKVFSTGGNLGYFGAAEYVMRQESPVGYDYIIISNVDVLMTENTILELVSTNIDSSIGWIAPTLYSVHHQFDWNPQSIKRYSKKKLRMMRFLFKHPFLLSLKQKYVHQYNHIQSYPQGDIYVAHGSFIILTRNYFKECGCIHYPVFLYYEEIFLAEECRKHQLRVIYKPQIHVLDIGKVSTGKIPAKTYCKFNYEGVSYILSHYY